MIATGWAVIRRETAASSVLVKGVDYHEDEVVGATDVRGWTGRVVLAAIARDVSTTQMVKRIRGGDR